MKINKKHVAILLGLLIGASSAFSATVVLSVDQDATVFVPNISQGTWTDMRIRWQSAADWGRNYPLIQLLPAGITVNYARFAFWTVTSDDGGEGWPADNDFPLLSMYNVTTSQSDTGGTQPSIDATAVDTYDHFDPDDFFVAPNTIVSNKAAWTFFDGTGAATLVANWANNVVSNYGIEVRGTGAYTDTSRYFHYASSDHPSTGVRPYLYVDYTAIPEPASLILFGIFAVGLLRIKKQVWYLIDRH